MIGTTPAWMSRVIHRLQRELSESQARAARWERAYRSRECLPCNICGDWSEVDTARIEEARAAVDDLSTHGDLGTENDHARGPGLTQNHHGGNVMSDRELIAQVIYQSLPENDWLASRSALEVADAIRAALDGRIIPALPDGWRVSGVLWSQAQATYDVSIQKSGEHNFAFGSGRTIPDAIADATEGAST